LNQEDYKTITCQRSWTLVDIHDAILKEAGYSVTLSNSSTANGSRKVNLQVGANGSENEEGDSSSVVVRPLEINIESITDVIRALQS
ncbi:hypothetical protein M2C68_20885, partial [Pseudomonas sp. BAgro211]|nr:hypothetical protein [Pseudomonas sp. BAgro211]